MSDPQKTNPENGAQSSAAQDSYAPPSGEPQQPYGVPYGAPQQPYGVPYGAPQQPYAQPPYGATQQPYTQQPYGQAAYPPPGQQPYAQQPFTPPSYAHPVVTKDHVAAGLLAIFLGIFGVHKFYLGYNTAGFIMLAITILGSIFTIGVAAGAMWIISIIEGIIYLAKSQSEFDAVYVANKKEWF